MMKNTILNLFPVLLGILGFLILIFSHCDEISQGDAMPEPVFPPTVVTGAISDVTTNSAVGSGNVTEEGDASVDSRGLCWSTLPEPTIDNDHIIVGSGTGSFSGEISGLSEDTEYYVRAWATNEHGTGYGNNVSFTTTLTGVAPSVATNAVTDVTDTTAICGGNVVAEGTSPVVIRGVCWSTSSNPVATDPHTNDGSGTGEFTTEITGLNPGTQYFVRAFATSNEGTAYGFVETFTTTVGGGGPQGNPCPDLPVLTDTRDGKQYPTVLIGDQCWLRENLNYTTGVSYCYDNDPANCDIYGRLYDWTTALTACPPGWHLPSRAELITLSAAVDNDAGKLKSTGTLWLEPNAGATNESGFTALPAGFWNSYQGTFNSMGSHTVFWSSTESAPSSPLAWYHMLVNYNTTIYNYENDKDLGHSVRCLRD
jgi:uncharacterized protein (TIGR02145 family)